MAQLGVIIPLRPHIITHQPPILLPLLPLRIVTLLPVDRIITLRLLAIKNTLRQQATTEPVRRPRQQPPIAPLIIPAALGRWQVQGLIIILPLQLQRRRLECRQGVLPQQLTLQEEVVPRLTPTCVQNVL